MGLRLALRCLLGVLLLTLSFGCSKEKEKGEDTPAEAESASQDGAESGAAKEDVAQAEVAEAPPAPAPEDIRLKVPEGASHPVYRLFDNRFISHPIRGEGFAARLGAPEGAKYTWGGHPREWIQRRSVDEKAVAITKGTRGTLVVPLSEKQAKEAKVLTLNLKNVAPRQQITVSLNEVELGERPQLEEGWQVLTYDIPTDTAVAGENKIKVKYSNTGRLFKTKTGGALYEVALSPAPLPDLDLSYGDEARRALLLPLNGGFAYYLMPYEGVRLSAKMEAAEGCRLDLGVESKGKSERFSIDPAWGEEISLQLDDYADQVVRMELVARAAEGATCQGITLLDPALVKQGEAAVAPKAEGPKNVVIWLVDTLRADHLKTYNPATDVQTPNLDAFAAKSTLFERFYIHGNESKVSHASLFTGLYPIRHRHLSGDTRVSNKFELIAESAKRSGRVTGGYISNGYVSKGWGFKQGFDYWVNTIRESKRNNAAALVKHARKFLDKVGEKPFFLYIGTIDPHVSYNRHSDFIGLYDPDDESWRGTPLSWNLTGSQMEKVLAGKLGRTQKEKDRIHALYKNEISYNDHHFGELLKELEARGMMENTLILVTADHGDEFWEHGKAGHTGSIYEELVRVPLMIYYPPLFPTTRVREGVGGVDIHPTLTHAYGIDPADVQGESLVGLANGVDRGYPRPSIATQKNIGYALRLDDWKIIIKKSGASRVFDLHEDLTETDDVASSHPIEHRWLTDAMGLFLAYDKEWHKPTLGVSSNLAPSFSETIATFEARSR